MKHPIFLLLPEAICTYSNRVRNLMTSSMTTAFFWLVCVMGVGGLALIGYDKLSSVLGLS